MASHGRLNANFDVTTHGMEILYDSRVQQQFLAFNFVLRVPISQLLQELLRFQHSDTAAAVTQACSGGAGAPGAAPAHARGLPLMRQQPPAQPPEVLQMQGWARPHVDEPSRGHDSGSRPHRPSHGSGPGHGQAQAAAWPAPGGRPGDAGSRSGLPPEGSGSNGLQAPREAGPSRASSVAESRVPSGSGIPPPPADDQGVDKTRAMFKAVSRGHASELRAALRRVGDVTVNVPGLDHGSFMQAALDVHRQRSAGGPQPPQTLELVSCLLQAKCSPNAPAADGKTPLHMAIQHHASMSPIVARLLLSASADLNARDATQRTPLDYVHEQSVDSGSPAIRQLMDEVTERPTVAVGVVEEESVLGAAFADAENDKVCFFTETSVGVFSVRARRIAVKMKLTQQRVQSAVRSMAVNPQTGTVAVFLEVFGQGQFGSHLVPSLIMIWPSGHMQEGEEPLKLSIDSGPRGVAPDALLPTLVSSTAEAPVTLLGRVCGGKVFCWRLNVACAQVVSQTLVCESGGLVAVSGGGRWLAAVSVAQDGHGSSLEVWFFVGKVPKRLTSLDKRPHCMAIVETSDGSGSGQLAIAEEPLGGQLASPIEVLRVQTDGSTSSTCRVRLESLCRTISFLHGSSDAFVSGHSDGAVIVVNIHDNQLRMSHDDVAVGSVAASCDHSCIVTTASSCLRVFTAGSLQVAGCPAAWSGSAAG